MKLDTGSARPGNHHGVGSGDNGTMGDGDSDGAGVGNDPGPYAIVAHLQLLPQSGCQRGSAKDETVGCSHCPAAHRSGRLS